jgi:hypothetical protein
MKSKVKINKKVTVNGYERSKINKCAKIKSK